MRSRKHNDIETQVVEETQGILLPRDENELDSLPDTNSSVSGSPRKRRRLYIGQSGRSSHARMKEHLGGLRRRNPENPLFKHILEEHDGTPDPRKFIMEIKGVHRGNVGRLLAESHAIEAGAKKHKLLNSKAEYTKNKLVKIVIHTEKH